MLSVSLTLYFVGVVFYLLSSSKLIGHLAKILLIFVSIIKYSALTHHFPQCIFILFKYEFGVYEKV